MDKFVQYTGDSECTAPAAHPPGLVMDYYDGNTVTGLWNYTQRFSMSDNSHDTEFGPSTPGAVNLVSGQTHGAVGLNAAGQVAPLQARSPASFDAVAATSFSSSAPMRSRKHSRIHR